MCGIAGLYFNDPNSIPFDKTHLENLVDELLLGIEHRGTDATGVAAVMPSGELWIEKADLPATSFNMWRKDILDNPRSVLLHTRYATKGTPMNLENNHPIHYNNVVATHNGHISNDDEIFKDESLERNAQVDSECIAALFDKYGVDRAHTPLGKLDGNYAVAVADLRKPNTLVLAKGWSSPLYYYEANEGLIWASEEKVIKNATEKVLGLELGYKDIDQLFFGELLFIEDGKVEKMKFKPYERKPYVFTSSHKKSDNKKFDTQSYYRDFSKKKDEVKQEKDTFGEFDKSDATHVEFWEKEPHELAYKIHAGGETFLFKRCDNCDTPYQTTLLTLIENDSILCPDCLIEYDEDNGVDNPAVVHEVAIELVAETFQTNPDFVNWLIFESEDDELNGNDQLTNLYIQFNDEYDKVYKELTGDALGAAQRWAEIATEEDEDESSDTEGVWRKVNDVWTFVPNEETDDCGVEVFSGNNPLSWLKGILA